MPLIVFNKPFRVLPQFTDDAGRPTLKDFIDVPGVYPAGRLDYDSEGLLLLTDDGPLQARISQPRAGTRKTYWAQVEGEVLPATLERLMRGVNLKDGPAKASHARRREPPADLWPRNPPVRFRKTVPDCWIELSISEGRNRQVRRMTAAAGHPCLRLIRAEIGPWSLDGLEPGEFRQFDNATAGRELARWKSVQRSRRGKRPPR